jgi:tetratricopeptide (TPR) repeat protein
VISALKSIAIAIVIIMLVTGGVAFAYGRWSHRAADADAALSRGQLEQALAAYVTAEARFDSIPVSKQLFAADYQHVVANELWVLYRLGRYDETIDKAERAPDAASPHLWAGCALFEKARREEKPDARLGWLTRAEEEFRRAVEAAPEDWDTKYDFELTTRLAAELRKQPKTPPKQLMQLLRPPMPTGKPTRRVG